MSLVSFKLDATTEVVGGWDPHDREFVLYVFDLRLNAVTSMLWSNLCDYDPVDKVSTARLRDRLAKYLGMTAPEGFWERVERKEPERIRYELVGDTWYRGFFRDQTFQVPMFDEPLGESDNDSRTGHMCEDREDPIPLQDSDIEVINETDGEVTQVRPRGFVRLVG